MNISHMQVELAIRKLEILKNKELGEREKEEEEEESQIREHLFDKWKRIQVNIRKMHKDMENEIDQYIKMEIKADIE